MLNNRHTNKLLKAANAAYPDGLIERLRKGEEEVGDGLAGFIFNEIKETAEGQTPREVKERVIQSLEIAARELDDVIRALREVKTRGTKKEGPRQRLKNFTVTWVRKGAKIYRAPNEKAAEEMWENDTNVADKEQTTDLWVDEGRDLLHG